MRCWQCPEEVSSGFDLSQNVAGGVEPSVGVQQWCQGPVVLLYDYAEECAAVGVVGVDTCSHLVEVVGRNTVAAFEGVAVYFFPHGVVP